jgi:MtN3 and saliva related transmembrane protein
LPVHGTRLFDLNYRTLAAITSTASFAPQAWKIIKTRETKDISTGMYGLTVAGFALWLAYGMMLGQWPLIATNSICFVLAAFILVMKLLPASGQRAVADTLDPSADGS